MRPDEIHELIRRVEGYAVDCTGMASGDCLSDATVALSLLLEYYEANEDLHFEPHNAEKIMRLYTARAELENA